jgi:hypothetical protein
LVGFFGLVLKKLLQGAACRDGVVCMAGFHAFHLDTLF